MMLDRCISPEVGLVNLSGPPDCNACILLMKVALRTLTTTVVIPNFTVLEKDKSVPYVMICTVRMQYLCSELYRLP